MSIFPRQAFSNGPLMLKCILYEKDSNTAFLYLLRISKIDWLFVYIRVHSKFSNIH